MTSAWLTVRKCGDLVREVEIAVERGREREMGAGSEVVHELRHRAPSSACPPPEKSDCTTTGAVRPHGFPTPGRSPVETSVAAVVGAPIALLNESERMPTVSPEPSTPCAARAVATFMSESASEIVGAHTALVATAPRVVATGAAAPTRGASTSPTYVTSGSFAIVRSTWGATSAVSMR